MERATEYICVIGVLFPLVGCDAIPDLGFLGPNKVTVRLVNDGSFDVEVEAYIAKDQEIPKSLLTSLGEKLDFTVKPGESTSFSRDCDDLQAIMIDDAELRILGGIGPDAHTDILRDGGDFSCGDTITFTFDHSLVVIDFDIAVSVSD